MALAPKMSGGRHRLWHLGTLLLLLGGMACMTAGPPQIQLKKPDGSSMPAPQMPSAAQEQFAREVCDEAARLARRGEGAAAARKREVVLSKYPATVAAAELWEARAQAAEGDNKPAQALAAYERLLFFRPNFIRADVARRAYAKLLVAAGRDSDALPLLMTLRRAASSVGEEVQLGLQLSVVQRRLGHADAALTTLVELHSLAQLPPPSRQHIATQATDMVATELSFAATQSLYEKVQSDARWRFVQPLLAYKLAKIYYHVRDYDRAEAMLGRIGAQYADSATAADAADFLRFLQARFEVEPRTIGVVLPLTGKFSLFGRRAWQAMELAISHVPAERAPRLVVKDSQGEPSMAAQAVETLVLQDHVIAVVGPLFSGEALAAALKAEELSVPLVALSHREGLPALGPYVFRTALTVAAQAKALAKVAFEQLGFSRFAVLYPKSRYGSDFTAAFWDEVDRRHGEIRGVESYEPDQTTFREPVRRLVGRWYLPLRPDFKAAMDALTAQNLPPMRLRAEVERLDKTLPPVVDFDAVVIPDSGRQIGLIAPALAFEDVVLTHDLRAIERIKKATKAEAKPVTLMGASTWNSPQTLDSCDTYCEDAVFVDAYFPGSTDVKTRDFIEAFRGVSKGAEPYLSEAQAYDTAAMLAEVLARSVPQSRRAMGEALLAAPPFNGVSGRFVFDAEGEAQKELYVLTIRDHAFRLLEATAASRP